MDVNQEFAAAEREGIYSNHRQEDNGGTKGDLSGWNSAGIFGKIQNLNEPV